MWTTHGRNRSTGVSFVGGLGIMEAAWNKFNVYGFPPGWEATPEQQMTIAPRHLRPVRSRRVGLLTHRG